MPIPPPEPPEPPEPPVPPVPAVELGELPGSVGSGRGRGGRLMIGGGLVVGTGTPVPGIPVVVVPPVPDPPPETVDAPPLPLVEVPPPGAVEGVLPVPGTVPVVPPGDPPVDGVATAQVIGTGPRASVPWTAGPDEQLSAVVSPVARASIRDSRSRAFAASSRA